MAAKSTNSSRDPEDPNVIQADMAKTRAALTLQLGELVSRLTSSSRPSTLSKDTSMAKKKPASASKAPSKAAAAKGGAAAAKKRAAPKAAAKASSASKTGTKVTATKVRRTAGKLATKATKVMGDALAGAAMGAVTGAAEALRQEIPSRSGGGKRGK